MKRKIPQFITMNMLISLTKQLYKNKFYEFVKDSKQNSFFMANGKVEYLCVVDALEETIEIFFDDESFQTAHSMFAGDEKGLTLNGFKSLSISKIDPEKFDFLGFETARNKHQLYKKDGKLVAYTARNKGEADIFVNEKEACMIVDVLEYLLAIQSFYKKGYETLPTDGKEYVLCFGFDDEEETYSHKPIELQNFKFFPDEYYFYPKNNDLVNVLKKFDVLSGETYLGLYFTKVLNGEDHNDPLLPIIMYGCYENEIFDYVDFKTENDNFYKTMRNVLEILVERLGHLSDTIITDNLLILRLFKNTFKALGIELKMDGMNPYNEFMWQTIDVPFAMDSEFSYAIEFIELMRRNYHQMVENALENSGCLNISDEELEEIFKEVADEYGSTIEETDDYEPIIESDEDFEEDNLDLDTYEVQ